MKNPQVQSYYDNNQFLYNIFWSKNALHYGLWDDTTASLAQAIQKTNEFIADRLDINRNDVVLDAGCGVGGTSIFFAKKYGAKTRGLTLSRVQIDLAYKNAEKERVSDLVEFYNQDFTATDFPDGSFTKIFGIESICYANPKSNFLRESHRLLRPGGKIAVMDAFVSKNNMSTKESNYYQKFLTGWAVPNLSSREDFRKDLLRAGFKKIRYYDKLAQVRRSSLRMYLLSLPIFPITWLFSKIGLIPRNVHSNVWACFSQKKVIDFKLVEYGAFLAEK